MIKTFTEDDLIRYVYGETSKHETLEIENAVICDPELEDQLINLKSTMEHLNDMSIAPSDVSVKKVLNFSKWYQDHL